jgi:hypothetical protein
MLEATEIGHMFLYLPFIPFPLQNFDPAICKGALPLRHLRGVEVELHSFVT